MREQYYTELLELYKRIVLKFQQHEALIPQGKQTEQHEKLKNFKIMLEHRLALMRVSKHDISVGLKEKLPIYERQIVNLITSCKNHSSQVQGQRQFQHSNVGNAHLIPEQQQSQSSQMPQGSGALLQMSTTPNVQHVSRPLSTEHQNILNILRPVSNSIAAQGRSFNSKNAIGSELMQQQQRHSLLQKRQPLQQDLHQQQQKQAQLPIPRFQQLHSMNELRQLKVKQGSDIKSRLNEYSAGQHHSYYYNQLKPRASYSISSPPILPPLLPQISNHSSPHIDQNGQLSSIPKVKGSPLSANSPLSVTPSTPFAPLPTPVDSEKQQSAISSAAHQQTPASPLQPHSLIISTPGISASPLLAECTSQDENQPDVPTSRTNATKQPVDRLIKVVQSLTPEALNSSVNDIEYVVSMIDRIAGSAPGNGSRAAAGENLVGMAKCHLLARNFMSQDGSATRKKLKRHTIALPLYDVFSPESNDDSFKQLHGFESSQLESTATSCVKRHKHEVNEGLLEEIWKINQKLIDTVVDVSENNEGEEGIVVKFTYTAIALSSGLKAQFACTRTSPMMTLRLEVPANYPACSPVLLNKLPGYPSKDLEDLSIKAKSKFSISLRHLAQPMSLGEMAKAWDICAREVILEYAQRTGGGSFSSTHGSWENCIAA
ncbi:uncharacterized protein A4U43_C01F7250 [Asparagus officinalis]|uniref:Mediator complex subunit 15 KIX domain-containing protein n=2 Tax=Asparagus officinalis TaxID=4686 RepID=A0A5P1FMJ7_ASPOF|nr:uncharacterized protein A4U43_C01F7250 [Asparagus officinalis]